MTHSYTDMTNRNAILWQLIRARIKEASKRHRYHLYFDISPLAELPMDKVAPVYTPLFPSRNSWPRPHCRTRSKRDRTTIQQKSLYTAVLKTLSQASTDMPPWMIRLEQMIENIEQILQSDSPIIDPPRWFEKAKKNGTSKKRRIAVFQNPAQVTAISILSHYLTKAVDPILPAPVCAFRASHLAHNRSIAIENLQRFRQNHKKPLYVAECDLVDFFNNIPHVTVRAAMARAQVKLGQKGFPPIYERAIALIDACLLAGTPDPTKRPGVGLAQGSPLSGVLANLVMLDMDEAIITDKHYQPQLCYYARFCDDMILVHTNKTTCRRLLAKYLRAMKRHNIPYHKPVKRLTYGKTFFEAKSKSVYVWGAKWGKQIPWVQFIGYQIRYDGKLRVRKESIHRQHKKIENTINNIRYLVRHTSPGKLRGSHETIFLKAAWHLVASSVGCFSNANPHNDAMGPCWTNAFHLITDKDCADKQYRGLDFKRRRELSRLKRQLSYNAKYADTCSKHAADTKDNGTQETKPDAVKHHKAASMSPTGWYFSYHSTLHHASRKLSFNRRKQLPQKNTYNP